MLQDYFFSCNPIKKKKRGFNQTRSCLPYKYLTVATTALLLPKLPSLLEILLSVFLGLSLTFLSNCSDFPESVMHLETCSIIKWRRQWHPIPVLLPGKSHGRMSLIGCSPWSCYESDTTERLHFHFSLSCTGEGNGNPLQCACLENRRDGRAWWAAVYGVAQSRSRLK